MLRAFVKGGLAAALMAGAVAADPLDDATAIQSAEQAVTGTLKDPDSVKFRSVVVRHRDCHGGPCRDVATGQVVVCGEVNAKNSYGGYVGFEPFMYWNGHLFGADLIRLAPGLYADGCGG